MKRLIVLVGVLLLMSSPAVADTDIELVTGDRVTVEETKDQIRVTLHSDSGDYETMRTNTGIYVIPEGLDLDRYDLELFNVTRLMTYEEEIPILVHGDDGIRSMTTSSMTEIEDPSFIQLDRRVDPLLNESIDQIDASIEDVNQTGRGINVSVIDSGIDDDHPDIDDVIFEKDFTDDGTTEDLNGHGTHIAGIIAGSGDEYRGVAPDVNLFNMRVLGADNRGYFSDIEDAIYESIDRDADIITMSIGGDPDERLPSIERAIQAAIDEGITVVSSAGNNGEYETITSPATDPDVISVGASATIQQETDDIASFSSRGPSGSDIKPEITAPGVSIDSTSINGSYVKKSGTSMSAPHVTGIIALMLEQSSLNHHEVKDRITTTADRLDADVFETGSGEINATESLNPSLIVSDLIEFDINDWNDQDRSTIRVTNPTDQTRTISIDRSNLTQIRGSDETTISVNRSSMTLQSNETKKIGINLTADETRGLYSGYLSIGDQSIPMGYRQPPHPDSILTIEKRSLDDRKIEEERLAFMSKNYTGKIMRFDGTTEIVPRSNDPIVLMTIGQSDDDLILQSKIIENPLNRSRVIMNETKTVEWGFNLSHLDVEEIRSLTADVSAGVDDQYLSLGHSLVGVDPSTTIRIRGPREDHPLQTEFSMTLLAMNETTNRSIDSPKIYRLLKYTQDPSSNISSPRSFRVLENRYHRDDDESYRYRHRLEPNSSLGSEAPVSMTLSHDLKDLKRQTVFHSIGDLFTSSSLIEEESSIHSTSPIIPSKEIVHQDLNDRPRFPSLDRMNFGNLIIEGIFYESEIIDEPRSFRLLPESNDQITMKIYEDNEKIRETTTSDGRSIDQIVDVDDGSKIRVTMSSKSYDAQWGWISGRQTSLPSIKSIEMTSDSIILETNEIEDLRVSDPSILSRSDGTRHIIRTNEIEGLSIVLENDRSTMKISFGQSASSEQDRVMIPSTKEDRSIALLIGIFIVVWSGGLWFYRSTQKSL